VKKYIFSLLAALCLVSCSISYKLTGSSIDYTTTKSISIQEFPIKASIVYAPLAVKLNDALYDKYSAQTRLEILDNDGDLQVSGAITGYSLSQSQVKGEEQYASEMRLNIKVKVKFVNKHNKSENFEREFSAFRSFSADELLADVQDGLCDEMVEELVNDIFNATVANW